MSKIDELIQEYCPDGVKHLKIDEVCKTISTGEQRNRDTLSKTRTPQMQYPVINGGISPSGYTDESNTKEKTTTVSQGGASAGFVSFMQEPFWSGAHCYTVVPSDTNIVLNRFLFFFLKDSEKILMDRAMGAGIPGLNRKALNSLKIPVPPLEVQKEIVNILDKFTQLEAELSAELSARQIQYEYYRSHLLGFDSIDLPRSNLGDMTMYSKSRIASDDLDHENYVGVDNLLQNRQGKEDSSHVPSVGNMTRYESGDVLIGNIRPYLKKIWNADRVGGTNGDVLVIHIKEECKNKLRPRYLYHLLASDKFFTFNMQNSKGAKMPRGDKDSIMKFEISVPPIEEQERVVSILDKFDKLVNGISEGLPAELKARREQYEYYRTKLLMFQEMTV